jgi:hypothetical protein
VVSAVFWLGWALIYATLASQFYGWPSDRLGVAFTANTLVAVPALLILSALLLRKTRTAFAVSLLAVGWLLFVAMFAIGA